MENKKCPGCGAEVLAGVSVCPQCGRAIEEQKLSPHLESVIAEAEKGTQVGNGDIVRSKKKRSKLLLISWGIGLLYAVYLIVHFGGGMTGASNNGELLGAALATTIVGPHMACAIVAVIFNIIGWVKNARWAALAGAILYAVSMVLFPMYFMFVLIQTILSFVGFAKMKKHAKE